jgi:calcineurin-like phosphoesterase family protein
VSATNRTRLQRFACIAAAAWLSIAAFPGTGETRRPTVTPMPASGILGSTISSIDAGVGKQTRTAAKLRVRPRRASVGTRVRLKGLRFPARRRVRITFGNVRLSDARTSRRGSFSKRFAVPSLPPGTYRISVRAGRGRARLGFVVTVADPLIAAAGDIACDAESPSFGGGNGTGSECHMRQTSDLVLGLRPDLVLALGDTQYEAGTPIDFRLSYNPTWGRFKSITRPIIGNHEYGHQAGAGYFDYFGALAGPRPGGYYSFDICAWHVVALNSNCDKPGVSCGPGSAQEQWLRADLASHRARCTLAFIHAPFFGSGVQASDARLEPFLIALHAAGAEVVLAGEHHHYERFAPQAPGARRDPAKGIREFVVGTGGRDLRGFANPVAPNSEVRNADTYGVLTLRLKPTSYDWRFVPEAGRTFTDAGSQACH